VSVGASVIVIVVEADPFAEGVTGFVLTQR
jgi:hypothetical protein